MSAISARQNNLQRYLPLTAMGIALALAFVGLPSALNLPLTNPTQSLAYAPVPGSSNNAPPGGNFSGLGEGSSSTVPGGPALLGGGGAALGGSEGTTPSNKQCVAGRQTEDPLAPPCVAYFSGNNGGSTYRGVSNNQINVVYYVDCTPTDAYQTSQGTESPTCGETDDANSAQAGSKFIVTRVLHAYETYFNSRYQTYGRTVHVWAHYSRDTVTNQAGQPAYCDDSCKRGDAANDIASLNPFATETFSVENGNAPMDGYIETMASHRVLGFDDAQETNSFYRQYPGLMWGFLPSVDDEAQIYATYICTQVLPNPTDVAGPGVSNGAPRKVGMVYYEAGYTTGGSAAAGSAPAPPIPYYTQLRDAINSDVQHDCPAAASASWDTTDQYGSAGSGELGGEENEPTDSEIMANMSAHGVTTIVWDDHPNGDFTVDGTHSGYDPEWVVLGDGGMEDFITGRYSDQTAWNTHAYVVTVEPFETTEVDKPCSQAILSVDPSWPTGDLPQACNMYDQLRQLWTGIQVAGPNLTPATMDQGFRAIPQRRSSNPQVPACFYPAGDYTCVKDAEVMWWDAQGQVPGWTGNGCYRAVAGGSRYLEGGWPKSNVPAGNAGRDPCSGFGGTAAGGPWVPD